MSDDADVFAQIKALVDEEHELTHAGGSADQRHERRERIEEQLDQCWDLLRQRQARRSAGEDPSQAHVRPAGEVEGYLQ
jgi:Protein of unknown function (DUF2630)